MHNYLGYFLGINFELREGRAFLPFWLLPPAVPRSYLGSTRTSSPLTKEGLKRNASRRVVTRNSTVFASQTSWDLKLQAFSTLSVHATCMYDIIKSRASHSTMYNRLYANMRQENRRHTSYHCENQKKESHRFLSMIQTIALYRRKWCF